MKPETAMTLNTHGWVTEGNNRWEKRKGLVATVINDIFPDRIGFQEFSANNQDLGSALKGLQLILGEEMADDRFNPIAFNSNRLTATRESGSIYFTDNGARDGNSIASEIRGATYAVFYDKQTKKNTLLVNTHLDHLVEEARVEGAQTILEFCDRYEMPVIVVGDFNSSYHIPHDRTVYTPRVHEMFLEAGFKDAFQVAHPGQINDPPNTFHNYEGRLYKPDRYGTWHIDTIFVRGMDVLGHRIVTTNKRGLYPADHYPVAAELRLPQHS